MFLDLVHGSKLTVAQEQCHTRYPWCLDYVLEKVPIMSEKDQITVIVGMDYLWTLPYNGVHDVVLALGYQPDRLEFRFTRDEIVMVHECLRLGWHGYSREMYQTWSKDWAFCTEPERTQQKQKLKTKAEEIKCALRITQDREFAARNITSSYLAAKRKYNEQTWQKFWEYKEEQAKEFNSTGIISTVAKQGRRGKIKWLKGACKDMAGKLGIPNNNIPIPRVPH